MSNRTSFRLKPVVIGTFCCLFLGVTGCRSTGTRLAGIPGMGWLGAKDDPQATELADRLPAPSSVTSPEPIRPQDEAIQVAAASGSASDKSYPATRYPSLRSDASDDSSVQKASATGRASFGYETGPYDKKGVPAAPGSVAPPEQLSEAKSSPGAAQQGMYDAEYPTTPAAPPTAAAPPQTTWAAGAASDFEADAASEDAPPQQFDAMPATKAPADTSNEQPSSRTSGWEDGATVPATGASQDLGYATGAIGRVPMDDSGEAQQVVYNEPVPEPAEANSVYEAKAKQDGPWRPGSTTSYR